MEKTEIEKLVADAIEAALAKPRCAPPSLGKWEPTDAEQRGMVTRDIAGMLAQTRHHTSDMLIVKDFNDRLYSFLKTELQNHWE